MNELPERIYISYDYMGAVCWTVGDEANGVEYMRITEAELTRLRGIEAAALNGQSRVDAVMRFRAMAREFVLNKDRAPLFAIADALEVKPC